MALLTRSRSPVVAGTVAAFLLVLIFGSPWFRDWAGGVDSSTAGGLFVRVLAWPGWAVDADESLRNTVSDLLRALFVVGLAPLFLVLMGIGSGSRGGAAQLLGGWGAFIFGSGAAALLTGVVRSDPSLLDTLSNAGVGAMYGLYAGWVVGLATLAGRSGS